MGVRSAALDCLPKEDFPRSPVWAATWREDLRRRGPGRGVQGAGRGLSLELEEGQCAWILKTRGERSKDWGGIQEGWQGQSMPASCVGRKEGRRSLGFMWSLMGSYWRLFKLGMTSSTIYLPLTVHSNFCMKNGGRCWVLIKEAIVEWSDQVEAAVVDRIWLYWGWVEGLIKISTQIWGMLLPQDCS